MYLTEKDYFKILKKKNKINRMKEKIFYKGGKVIFYKIEKQDYIIQNENFGKCRESKLYFFTNEGVIDFNFYQGIALENKPSFFEIMHCIFQDKQYLNLNLYDFLDEFGYSDSLENVRKGESIYRDIQKNTEKLNKILKLKKAGFRFYNAKYQ